MSDQPNWLEWKSSELGIVLVQVTDGTSSAVRKDIESVFSAAQEMNGTVVSNVSSLVLIAFGLHGEVLELSAAAERILAAVGEKRAKAMYNRRVIDHGNLGAGDRYTYTLLIPNFSAVLARFSHVSFGEVASF